MTPSDRIVSAWERAASEVAERWRRSAAARRVVAGQWRRTRRWPLTWMTVYAAVFVVLGYGVLDRPLAFVLKARIGGEFEGFLKTVTHLGLAAVWLVPSGLLAVAIMLAWRAAPLLEMRARLARAAWVPGFVFLSVALSGLLNLLIKTTVGRTRPRALFEDGVYDFAPLTHAYLTNSFPSGHTQAAFAAMTALTFVFPRYDVAFIAMAVLVAASRVLTTVHFLSDAVMGAWVGVVVTVLLHRLLDRRGIHVRLRFERDRKLND
ncbi:MAG: phosphatase PAP2 family protein [Phaeospirillum sp.]|nr:phosphatase PAP2 family protein [Phaeospirillum sp.]